VVGIELFGDETLNHKPHFLLRKCAKTHLQQCRISTFPGGEPPGPPLRSGEGKGEEGRGVEGREGG